MPTTALAAAIITPSALAAALITATVASSALAPAFAPALATITDETALEEMDASLLPAFSWEYLPSDRL